MGLGGFGRRGFKAPSEGGLKNLLSPRRELDLAQHPQPHWHSRPLLGLVRARAESQVNEEGMGTGTGPETEIEPDTTEKR